MITAADATVAPQGFTSAAGVKVFNQGMLDFGDLAPSPTPSPAPAPAQAKAKAKAKQTKKPAPAPTPTPRQTQQGPVKMFNQGMLSFDDDFGLAPAPAPAAAPARAPAPAPAADAANIPGYLFVCSSATEGECFQRQLFGLGAGRLQSMQSSITTGSTPVFLLNFKTRVVHGVFESVGQPALNISSDAWAKKARGAPSNYIVSVVFVLQSTILLHLCSSQVRAAALAQGSLRRCVCG